LSSTEVSLNCRMNFGVGLITWVT